MYLKCIKTPNFCLKKGDNHKSIEITKNKLNEEQHESIHQRNYCNIGHVTFSFRIAYDRDKEVSLLSVGTSSAVHEEYFGIHHCNFDHVICWIGHQEYKLS